MKLGSISVDSALDLILRITENTKDIIDLYQIIFFLTIISTSKLEKTIEE
jgi:hypothetical protein